jgi:signal transduction histidine kinase
MRERLAALDGTLALASQPGRTVVRAQVPSHLRTGQTPLATEDRA